MLRTTFRSQVLGGGGVREITSPVILRERRPAASRPVGEGEGSAIQAARAQDRFRLSVGRAAVPAVDAVFV
jgi:hypothetical protein